jgi:hypothetical protein
MPSDKNPFAAYLDFRAAIFHREPHHQVQVIRANQVHSHANQQPWEGDLVVMRAIDRVRLSSRNILQLLTVTLQDY